MQPAGLGNLLCGVEFRAVEKADPKRQAKLEKGWNGQVTILSSFPFPFLLSYYFLLALCLYFFCEDHKHIFKNTLKQSQNFDPRNINHRNQEQKEHAVNQAITTHWEQEWSHCTKPSKLEMLLPGSVKHTLNNDCCNKSRVVYEQFTDIRRKKAKLWTNINSNK